MVDDPRIVPVVVFMTVLTIGVSHVVVIMMTVMMVHWPSTA